MAGARRDGPWSAFQLWGIARTAHYVQSATGVMLLGEQWAISAARLSLASRGIQTIIAGVFFSHACATPAKRTEGTVAPGRRKHSTCLVSSSWCGTCSGDIGRIVGGMWRKGLLQPRAHRESETVGVVLCAARSTPVGPRLPGQATRVCGWCAGGGE